MLSILNTGGRPSKSPLETPTAFMIAGLNISFIDPPATRLAFPITRGTVTSEPGATLNVTTLTDSPVAKAKGLLAIITANISNILYVISYFMLAHSLIQPGEPSKQQCCISCIYENS